MTQKQEIVVAVEQAVTKLSKAEQMAAFRQQFPTGGLKKVEGVEPLDIYVKELSAKEFRDLGAFVEQFEKNCQDGLNDERQLSRELYTVEGNYYFQYDDLADMEFLAALPVPVKSLLANAAHQATWGDYLQKKALLSKIVTTS